MKNKLKDLFRTPKGKEVVSNIILKIVYKK